MSWFIDSPLGYVQKFCINVLKTGAVPRHVAIIMDGNRRFAKKTRLQCREGHTKGFDKLAETLQWCLEFGIREVTVYAFSIENFKRPQEEVDALMQLAREKYLKLTEEKEKLMEEGVCIRVIGNLSLIPPDIRASIAEVMLMTKDNTRTYLNIAFAYTSRDEIANAVKTVVEAVKSDELDVEDIDERLISDCLYSSSEPDVVIRTSGEVRFSDFLLWQIGKTTNVCFTKVLWPEFSIWHLMGIIFYYQRCCKDFPVVKKNDCGEEPRSDSVRNFLKNQEAVKLAQLESYVNSELK